MCIEGELHPVFFPHLPVARCYGGPLLPSVLYEQKHSLFASVIGFDSSTAKFVFLEIW